MARDFITFPAKLLRRGWFEHVDMHLIAWLDFYADGEGWCRAPIDVLASECHVSLRTIQRTLATLVGRGWVEVEARFAASGAQLSNRYRVNFAAIEAGDNDPEATAPTRRRSVEDGGRG